MDEALITQLERGTEMDKYTDIFSYHAPTPEQVGQYQRLREGALAFTRIILAETPGCADQSAAIRKVREAVMTANAAVALNGVS